MKGFFYGLTAGLAAGVVAQMMIAKNHEQMLELVKNFPRPTKFGSNSSLEDLLAQREILEEMIIKKQTEETEAKAAAEQEQSAETEEKAAQEPEADDPAEAEEVAKAAEGAASTV